MLFYFTCADVLNPVAAIQRFYGHPQYVDSGNEHLTIIRSNYL